jgi:hypothetical protein
MSKEVSASHDRNAAYPMPVTELPMVTEVRAVQSENAYLLMTVTPAPITTDWSEVQPEKQLSPMLVTLSGITTEVTLSHDEKASLAKATTDIPPMVDGMETAPPWPTYSVMVTFPPLVE